MYAVYVLAAILLSVAPMHATAVLASLPSVARDQRANPVRIVRGERIAACSFASPVAHASAPAPRPRAMRPRAHAAQTAQFAPLPAAHLLAHSPNAP